MKQLASDLQGADCFQGFRTGWTAEFSKVDVEQFETVVKRDRERAKTLVVSAPEGRVVPNDQLLKEDIDDIEHRCECGEGFMCKKALQLHQLKKHQKVDMRMVRICGNTNTNVRKLHDSTKTSQHATRDPTTQQQGWRFGLVSPWRLDHTRGSRQDIHSTRVPITMGRLWMARQPPQRLRNPLRTLTW